ncbi:MAG: DUF3135 domain-containing protein [Betaproteobacteria bacterium]|nr:DUF3135 domain-containing protein [Betaproteobacteria bacterium]
MEFDWETWSTLARDDPEEFERRRIAAIEDFISRAPSENQQRLRGLQFRIDMERERSSSPLGACIRMNRMMWESFSDLRNALEGLTAELEGAPREPVLSRQDMPKAQVLPFRGSR